MIETPSETPNLIEKSTLFTTDKFQFALSHFFLPRFMLDSLKKGFQILQKNETAGKLEKTYCYQFEFFFNVHRKKQLRQKKAKKFPIYFS